MSDRARMLEMAERHVFCCFVFRKAQKGELRTIRLEQKHVGKERHKKENLKIPDRRVSACTRNRHIWTVKVEFL